MKFAKLLVTVLATASLLAGCGGGSSFQSAGAGGSTSAVATISVSSSVSTVAPDGSTTAVITGVLRDGSNNFVSGEKVTFATSAGGLAITQQTSDAGGNVTATLSANGVTAGTSIVVSVTNSTGKVTGKTTVKVGAVTQTLTLTTSAAQIPSDGSKAATLTALVRDGNNNVVSGVAVNFASTSGSLSPAATTTDKNGSVTASLSTGSDPTNRTIDVTASIGSGAPVKVSVVVSGTTLSLTGPVNIVTGGPAQYTVQLSNSAGTGIANQSVVVSSKLGNTLTPATVVTNATGQAVLTLTPATGGSDTLTASAIGLSAAVNVTISSQSFSFTTPASGTTPKVALNTPYTATVTWTNAGSPVQNMPIQFAATRGALSNASLTTDAAGHAQVTIQSTNAGPAVLTASGGGVTTSTTIDFIATVPSTVTIQPSVTSVPTQGSSTIVAVVRDANQNLVEGATVDFTLNDSTGGTLTVPQAVTDAQGVAQTVYKASSSSGATGGVTITATVPGTLPVVTKSTSLTVGGQAVFLSFGTGGKIAVDATLTVYTVEYVVFAVDGQGAAVPNVPVTVGIQPVKYRKGFWCHPGVDTECKNSSSTSWIPYVSVPRSSQGGDGDDTGACFNEDVNHNAILDAGEDFNNDGKLEPGAVGVVSTSGTNDTKNGVTDSTGQFHFSLSYPEDHCVWVSEQLSATAVVQGTESSASSTTDLLCLATDVNDLTKNPPGSTIYSPYGTASLCADSK